MDLQKLLNDAGQALTDGVRSALPGLPPKAVRYGGAALLAAAALVLVLLALRLLRGAARTRAPKRVNVPRLLQRSGTLVDVLRAPTDQRVPLRCVITGATSGKVRCEIVERLNALRLREGGEVTCVFSPMRIAGGGRINAFRAKVLEAGRPDAKADRLVLAAPRDYSLIPRRKHGRKRVADQQFIRVKLWMADPFASDLAFEDAAPQIGVNSFGNDGPSQAANAVVNISDGGLGLLVLDRLLPETCVVGSAVTLNLFMFNFREKAFRPFWYTGRVRAMNGGAPGFTRLGIAFDGYALPDDRTGALAWEKF